MRLRGEVVTIALALASPAVAGTSTFSAGSLIIPTSSVYQNDCGTVSAYGLIYDVLRANAWLAANGYSAITVRYAYLDTKTAPNRCVPTNLHVPPAYSGTPSPVWSDPNWNDGCDFRVADTTQTVVKLIDNANATNTAKDTNVATISTTGKGDAYPQYPAKTIVHTTTNSTNVTTVGYLGGPFIISSTDAPTFTKLVQGTLIAKDSQNNTIDFTAFRSNKGTCTYGTTHYVNIHRAMVPFQAPLGKDFTAAPPRLALLATDKNTGTGTIYDGILETYLQAAGLDFTGAQGCPPGGANASKPAVCPNGGTPGQIFDIFDFADLKNNLEAMKSSGKNLYQMVWLPHWESTATSSTGPNSSEINALGNLATFLDNPGGLMAECASISTIEGAYVHGTSGSCSGGFTSWTSCAYRSGPLQLQTCVNNGSGTCAAGTTPWGMNRDQKGFGNSYAAIKNCSDVTTTGGSTCAYYSYPGDSYSQTADYVWNSAGYNNGSCINSAGVLTPCYTGDGVVSDFLPNTSTNSIYKPGVLPLISAVASLDRTKLATPALARAMIVSDLSTRSVKDDAPNKANIAYVGGHDLSGTVAGTKIILETLLQLGFTSTPPPATVTTEVARASPVVTTVNNNTVLVQGTFESQSPAPTVPTVNLAGDLTTFYFPYYKGHMRARTAASINTTASGFGTGTVLFDAGNGIPNVSYGGCSTNFIGNCRTVFTTTTVSGTGTTRNPSLVFFKDSNADTLGPLIAPGLAHTQWASLVERVLAGIPRGSSYVAQLGGVDRSTVAVIGSSPLAGSNRPVMAYFGATDGMLHAVCASVDSAHGCDALGRELWAFMPRVQLPFVRLNTTRIDGSPRVADLFGDFYETGTKSFKTILTFQTGAGDATTSGQTPAVYSLDVSNPQNPKVIWEYTIANPASRGTYELGQGEASASGVVSMSGINTPMVFAETSNGGTGGAGVVTTAILAETGAKQWQVGYTYPSPRVGGHLVVPATGIPGGAVAVDKTNQGLVSDVVWADLYGSLWEYDPATGTNRYGTKALFSFATDYHAIGAVPPVYATSTGGEQFALLVSGGYADLADTTWGTATQYALGVRLNTPAGSTTLDDNSGAPNVPFKLALGSGENAYAQALVVGNQLFMTTDSADVNATGYGTTATTGHVYSYNLSTGAQGATVVVSGGASSVANNGTSLYVAASNSEQQLGGGALSTSGASVNSTQVAKVTRKLWLRTE